jgi:Flp pilus assembly pilin Flp
MTVIERLIDGARHAHIRSLQFGGAIRDHARRARRDERGQTSTEYLMIVGLMAAVILLAFVTFFWDTVKAAASEWAGKVADAISGNPIQ